MGNFRIQIDAVGGHGCDRTAKPGEALKPCDAPSCPDCAARRLVADFLKTTGAYLDENAGGATLTHWPADIQSGPEVVDDLVTGTRRRGSFQDATSGAYEEHILQFFAYEHLPPHLQAVSAPFKRAALRIVHTLPRNPERTVALRKLLEAKDAAVRALLAK